MSAMIGALEIERFLIEEAALLDRGAFDNWVELFTIDGWYWVPISPAQTDPFDHVSLFFENKSLMRMRAERLKHPRAHGVASPIRTSRVLGNVLIHGGESGDIVVRSRFHMTRPVATSIRSSRSVRSSTVVTRKTMVVSPPGARSTATRRPPALACRSMRRAPLLTSKPSRRRSPACSASVPPSGG